MDFKAWTILKKVKASDLIFIQTLSDGQAGIFNSIADKMAGLNPSFSEGISFLEKVADLIQMGHTENLLNESESFSSWEQALYKLRYPVTSERDEIAKKHFEQLPWPAGAKLKFERRGDRAGVEVRIFISSPTDITKVISSLERVQTGMKQ